MADAEVILNVLVEVNKSGDSPYENNNNYSGLVISNEARRVVETVFYVFCCGILGCLGSVANVINIIIFIKQGFNDSVNISLIGLALSDLGILVTIVWTSICHNPLFQNSYIGYDCVQVEYLTLAWPHESCVRITSWITAFITFERCVCIILPMKVKDLITPKRTFITVTVIYLITIVSIVPLFCSIDFPSSFRRDNNTSLIRIVYNMNGALTENVTTSVIVVARLTAVILVIICAVLLILNLEIKSKWRQTVTTSSNRNSLPSRDKRIMKMVTVISCTFIVCYLPGAINLILIVQLNPDYSVVGRYHNLYSTSWSIISTLETINSSINILIYYNMSSKFRDDVGKHFGMCTVSSRLE